MDDGTVIDSDFEGVEFISLHLDTYGTHPDECWRCSGGVQMVLIESKLGGVVLIHKQQVFKHKDYCDMHVGGPCNCLPGMD